MDGINAPSPDGERKGRRQCRRPAVAALPDNALR